MLQNPTSSPLSILSAPSKAFLMGEYAVLAGEPALVATFKPQFTFRELPETELGDVFKWQSPASKLLLYAHSEGFKTAPFEFKDPHQGRGGFGASSAEYLLAYQWIANQMGWDLSWQAALKLYKRLTQSEGVSPSGADVVAQACGGVCWFDPKAMEVESLRGLAQIWILSATSQADRKVATHTHLRQIRADQLSPRLTSDLGRLTREGRQALELTDLPRLGATMTAYAEILDQAELELPATREDRLALLDLPGVLGVKGAGAMGADALVVILDSVLPDLTTSFRNAVHLRGLEVLAAGVG